MILIKLTQFWLFQQSSTLHQLLILFYYSLPHFYLSLVTPFPILYTLFVLLESLIPIFVTLKLVLGLMKLPFQYLPEKKFFTQDDVCIDLNHLFDKNHDNICVCYLSVHNISILSEILFLNYLLP